MQRRPRVATNVTYYPNGAIAGFTYGNGVVHTLTQNTRGLPDRSKDADGSTSIHDDSYDYDAVGNVLAISDAVSGNRGNRDMAYDDLNRLASATSPMFGTASYSYDVLDNLTHVQVTAGSQPRNQDYCYDEHNRLTNLMTGGCSGTSVLGLGYDVQGNLANRNGTTHTFTFDYSNRLRTGELESYRYDVQGRRIRSSSSAGVVYSLYAQSGQLLFQKDERSAKRRQYIYLGGSLVAESDMPLVGSTATVTYQHTDALGTPVAITSSSKTVLERREYEPYGYQTTPVLQDGPNFTGHVADAATGLIYMQARYYDPLIGRFDSVDAVTALQGGPQHFNSYDYAYNNPYKFTDPDGRSGCDTCRDMWNSVLQFFGMQAADAGSERERYSQQASQLDRTDSAGRADLKAESRARTPSMPRAVVGAARPSTGAKPGTGGTANASNAAWNSAGRVMKIGGRVMVAATVVQQANEIANSPEPARDVAGAGGMTLGAIGGGEGGAALGATIGAVGGPPGIAVGAIVGGLIGSATGGAVGERAAEGLYDKAQQPLE